MTNFEKIKNMSVEEIAKAINGGISSDPCDYCINSNEFICDGIRCFGKDDIDIIANWLNSEVQE